MPISIPSRTIASLEHAWAQERDLLTSKDVLVIDEAGMIGSRQLERVLSEAEARGAKVVMVGDPEQLQSIEAGAAFRSVAGRHGAVEITDIRRQHDDWQRDATRHLATGRTAEAIGAYAERDMVHAADTCELARGNLIDTWDRERIAAPGQSRIILTHTNAEVRDLNELARGRLREAGSLGDDVKIMAERGDRNFATGDRIMFLKNDRALGVKNGSLGEVEKVTPDRIAVRLDSGRSIAFDTKDYVNVDHGYAATIHKSQGVTVDRTHVLATPGLDRHSAYVALSRHREGVQFHFGRDDFADQGKLVRTLSRDRAKNMASDYAPERGADQDRNFAERRSITFRERLKEVVRKVVPEKMRGMFDGFRPNPIMPEQEGSARPESQRQPKQSARERAEQREVASRRERTNALIRHARAVDTVFKAEDGGHKASPDQKRELSDSRKAFEKVRPHGWRDAEAAYVKNDSLPAEAASGNIRCTVNALQLETEIRTGPAVRADKFVARWQALEHESSEAYRHGGMAAVRPFKDKMAAMAKGLERDPQMESILRNRKLELGISFETGRSLGAELAFTHGIDLGRGRGLGI